MKHTHKLFSTLLVVLLITVTACKKETITDNSGGSDMFTVTETTVGNKTFYRLVGTIDENYTFTKDKNWLLSGGVFVGNGATLTIEEGTQIYADPSEQTTAFLSITQGAKINAQGTANDPIVFTSINTILEGKTPNPGDWGGLIVNGYAKINVGQTAEGEGGTGIYGGDNDEDNSGTIRYVRLEYAGRVLGEDNELNGFSFNGVGNGTTVEYIQSYMGEDDGIEFFGGTVNVKYAVSTGSKDDSFDWTHGWRGKGQFWVAVQTETRGDRGIEADNLEGTFTATPISNPILSNITLIGGSGNKEETIGIRLRHGTQGKLFNTIVTKFAEAGIQVNQSYDDPNEGVIVDPSAEYAQNGTLAVMNSIVTNITSETYWKDAATEFNTASFKNTTGVAIMLTDEFKGIITDNATDPTTLDAFFSSASYIGAVDPNNDWTAGWTK